MNYEKSIKLAISVLSCIICTGCSTLFGTNKQNILLETFPEDARCDITNSDKTIVTIDSTPKTFDAHKSDKQIQIVCNKLGFQQTKILVEPKANVADINNILATGTTMGVVGAAGGVAVGSSVGYPVPAGMLGASLGTSFGLFWGLLGWTIDSIGPTRNSYPEIVHINLAPARD